MQRLLGKIEGEKGGPLIVCVAALHGNEQVGIHAFRNVYSAIVKHQIKFKGKLVGVIGNIKAVQSNRRFIDYDMNRAWTPTNLLRIRKDQEKEKAEDAEMRALFDLIAEESKGKYSSNVMVDLHSTSSDKGNFIVVDDRSANHPIIKALHIPTIVGLEEYLPGTLLDYYNQKGGFVFRF